MNGQCHAFACVLAETFRWQPIVIAEYGSGAPHVLHCVAETADGAWADARGYHDRETYVEQHGYEEGVDVEIFQTSVELLMNAHTRAGFATMMGVGVFAVRGMMLPPHTDFAYSVLAGWEEKYGLTGERDVLLSPLTD